MATMIISEKNKAAIAIAEALGPVQTQQEGKGLKVYFVPSKQIYVVPLRGHIQQYTNVGDFVKWNVRDPREIITNPNSIAKMPSNYAGGYIRILKKYAKLCNVCIIGTDADVEGCNIGMMDALPFVKQVRPQIQVKQLWLNDLQPKGIQTAYQNLIAPKWAWAHSGEARAIIDAIIGFSATREVSLSLRKILNQIGVKFTSIGRVQTSLLYLLYLREHLIRNFNPSPFWTISAQLKLGEQQITARHIDNNFSQQLIAETIYNSIKDEKIAYIDGINSVERDIPLPKPLNTSKALLLITKKLKITAANALKTLETLYLNKIISYPRTDSDVYSKDYDHVNVLKEFLTHSKFGTYTQDLFRTKHVIPHQGTVNAGDHSPITPLISLEDASSKFENQLQKNVYNLIAKHYLALFGEKPRESDTKLSLKIKEEKFTARIQVLIKSGYYDIAPFLSKKYDAPPAFLATIKATSRAATLPIQKIHCLEKETQPPPRYTDTSLLQLMERKHLGTKSTRPNIIQILIDRNYIERKSRSFYVKELGFLLMDALKVIWEPFLDPKFTAEVEGMLEEIRQSKKSINQVIRDVRVKFLDLFDKFRNEKPNILSKMNQISQTGNVTRGRSNKILSNSKSRSSSSQSSQMGQKKITLTKALCPKCQQNPMKLIISHDKKKKFLVCADEKCKTYLSLPKKGTPRLLTKTCCICKFNIVKYISYKNKHKFEYYICPVCWNKGLNTKSGEGFCSSCVEYKIEKGKCVKKT